MSLQRRLANSWSGRAAYTLRARARCQRRLSVATPNIVESGQQRSRPAARLRLVELRQPARVHERGQLGRVARARDRRDVPVLFRQPGQRNARTGRQRRSRQLDYRAANVRSAGEGPRRRHAADCVTRSTPMDSPSGTVSMASNKILLDVRLQYEFRMAAAQSLGFFWEIYNAPEPDQLRQPDRRPPVPDFMQSIVADLPRTMQLGFRYTF